MENLFAPAEEFAEILEEAGSSKHKPGMAASLATTDNAGMEISFIHTNWRTLNNWNSKKKSIQNILLILKAIVSKLMCIYFYSCQTIRLGNETRQMGKRCKQEKV